jgi:hypothetical protein
MPPGSGQSARSGLTAEERERMLQHYPRDLVGHMGFDSLKPRVEAKSRSNPSGS